MTVNGKIKKAEFSFPDNCKISKEARNLIKRILVLDPNKRPKLNEILFDDFFNQGIAIPKLMPTSTLAYRPTKEYLNKYIPDIISFLDKHDINHGFFSHGWILTLFSNSMKKEYLVYTWSFMIIFGWKFFYSFVIQILLWYKKEIFKANINILCSKMKNILSDDDFGKNYKNIIRNTFSFMNKYIVL